MALKRKKLIDARTNAGLSQEALAEEFGITRITVWNWENGATEPYPHHRGLLKARFGIEDSGVDAFLEVTDEPDEQSLEGKAPPMPVICVPASLHQRFIASNPVRLFWQIAHTDYDITAELTADIQAAIKDLTMTGDIITRRDALMELASIPMISLGKHGTLHCKRYEELLRFCTAALEGCWELYRGSDTDGARHAFDCCCTYVPLLETIAHDSSRLRKQVLDLAARYALLQTMFGWRCTGRAMRVGYAQNARSLSEATGNVFLQLSASTKLGTAYLNNRQYAKAWKTMQEGEHILKAYQHRKKSPLLPSGIIGNFYSSLARVQTRNGIDPDTALGIATDSEPLDGPIAFIEFTASAQWLEAAMTCCAQGNYKQAMTWIKKRIDPATLAPRVPQSEGGRVGAMNTLTHALLLQSEDRDMKEIIRVWTAGMTGAQTLRYEKMYQDAMTNFERMQILWPHEDAIRKLMPLTSHW